MINLIYSFFITLLILILKIKFSFYGLAILSLILLIQILKKSKKEILLGLFTAALLNPVVSVNNKSNYINGKVQSRGHKYFIVKTPENKIVVWSDKKPTQGSLVSLKGEAKLFKNNESFDEKSFWNSKGVAYKILNPKFTYIEHEKKQNDYIYSWFKLVFQNKKDSNTELVYKSLQQLGLAHIVVISSFHFSFLFYLLIWFKKPIRLLFLTLFCWYIGFPGPAQKALIFLSLITLVPKIDKLQALAISGYVILLLQPYMAISGSFILTMIFSTSILLFGQNATKLQKMISLRLIGFYITWLWTSSIYLLNFITILLSPIIFIIYFAVFIRWEWLLKTIAAFIISLNKINFPIVIGQTLFLKIALLIILILLIRSICLFHKSSNIWISMLLMLLVLGKLYFRQISFVTFLNIGQGDAAIIKFKDKTYLVDVGKKGQFQKVIKPYLLKHGISKINNIYISHDHFDHSGGLQDDFGKMKVLNEPNPNIYNLNTKEWNNLNDNSQVLFFKNNNSSFLFTGDISKKVEKYIANKLFEKIDVLKVAHHGSNTSTAKYFIEITKPEIAVISYGKNRYGHPSQEVIETLKKHDVKIHETNKSGHLKIML